MCSPFEVKWQCVGLEHQNVVDDVMSIDSDHIALGVKKCFNVNFNSETLQVHDKNVDIFSDDKNILFSYE